MTHPTYRTADVEGFEDSTARPATRPSRRCCCCTGLPKPSHMFGLIPRLANPSSGRARPAGLRPIGAAAARPVRFPAQTRRRGNRTIARRWAEVAAEDDLEARASLEVIQQLANWVGAKVATLHCC
jgi:hypothetical protein